MAMTREKADEFATRELARIRDTYEHGVALHCPTAFLLCRKDPKGEATVTEEAPAAIMMVMADMDDDSSKLTVRKATWEHDGFAACVSLEIWYVAVPHDAPPEVVKKAREAGERGELHLLEPPLRRERVQVYIETEDFPIQFFTAEITRENPADEKSKPTLGPWEEQKLSLPRPNFKRYLPEIRDGKRCMVIPFPGLGQNVVLASK